MELAYVDCDEQYMQYDMEWHKSWEPSELLQVPNPPCFSYHSHLAVRDSAELARRRLSAMGRSEFVVLFLTCF